MERVTLFVDVLLPLALPDTYTYRVPYELNSDIFIGQRVVVQFGKQKIYTALVYRIHENAPKTEAKYILSVLDQSALVNGKQYQFWEWLSSYYLATKGEVMNAALPSGLKLASETKLVKNPSFSLETTALTDKEYLIYEALDIQEMLSLEELSAIVNVKNPIPLIKTLLEKEVIWLQEEILDDYKQKTIDYICLHPRVIHQPETLKQEMDSLEKKAFKQLEIVLAFLSFKTEKIPKKDLLLKANATTTQLNALLKKEFFQQTTEAISRFTSVEAYKEMPVLSPTQQEALNNIRAGYNTQEIMLLHGVTSSGKTEIYIHLIAEYIAKKEQVLYLLPEIALTSQIIERLQCYFGDRVGIYHSRFNKHERVEVWQKTIQPYDTRYDIVLGPRSALFLPFSQLGLVIIDEEHDASYKQQDPAPRYHGRDAGIYLAHLHGAKTLLGSATPAIESYYNALTGKYGLVELSERYNQVPMPEVVVVDTKIATKLQEMQSHFSTYLINKIREALAAKEQVILFQNRRGFSVRIECNICGWTPKCKWCDVSLTYHKMSHALKCHYCGYKVQIPTKCESCESQDIQMKGFGTEKIEDELPLFFPDVRVGRMDLDTTRSKQAYKKIMADFEQRELDILVGTQMITKGLDFNNVSLVGVLNADNMLNFPDFRAYERSFQQLVQVSGRAGRREKKGLVVIQSQQPFHPVINYTLTNDYATLYQTQIQDRKDFKYPPYYRLIKITLKHPDAQTVEACAKDLGIELRRGFKDNVLGPESPLIGRVKNYYIKQFIIKIKKDTFYTAHKNNLALYIDTFKTHHLYHKYKSVRINLDVDPI